MSIGQGQFRDEVQSYGLEWLGLSLCRYQVQGSLLRVSIDFICLALGTSFHVIFDILL